MAPPPHIAARSGEQKLPGSDHLQQHETGWGGVGAHPCLAPKVLAQINEWFKSYNRDEKIQCLLYFFHARASHLARLKRVMQSIIDQAVVESDEWVRALARLLNGYPESGQLNLCQVDIEASYRLSAVARLEGAQHRGLPQPGFVQLFGTATSPALAAAQAPGPQAFQRTKRDTASVLQDVEKEANANAARLGLDEPDPPTPQKAQANTAEPTSSQRPAVLGRDLGSGSRADDLDTRRTPPPPPPPPQRRPDIDIFRPMEERHKDTGPVAKKSVGETPAAVSAAAISAAAGRPVAKKSVGETPAAVSAAAISAAAGRPPPRQVGQGSENRSVSSGGTVMEGRAAGNRAAAAASSVVMASALWGNGQGRGRGQGAMTGRGLGAVAWDATSSEREASQPVRGKQPPPQPPTSQRQPPKLPPPPSVSGGNMSSAGADSDDEPLVRIAPKRKAEAKAEARAVAKPAAGAVLPKGAPLAAAAAALKETLMKGGLSPRSVSVDSTDDETDGVRSERSAKRAKGKP